MQLCATLQEKAKQSSKKNLRAQEQAAKQKRREAARLQGYMRKRALKSGKNWKDRYFVLEQTEPTWAEGPKKKIKGRLHVTGRTELYGNDDDEFGLEIVVDPDDDRADVLHVSCGSKAEFKAWHIALSAAIKLARDT